MIAEKDELLAASEQKLADAEAEITGLSTELEETNAKLEETSAELLQANMTYEALLEQKNEFQHALESMQDDLAARIALAEEEAKPNKQLPKYSNVDYANDQLREYYDQLQKLQDSVLTLQIENTLLREKIDEFTN